MLLMQTYNEMLPFFGATPRQPTSLRWNVALESRRRQGAYKRTSSVTSWNWTNLNFKRNQNKNLQLLIVVGWEYCVRETECKHSIRRKKCTCRIRIYAKSKEFKTYTRQNVPKKKASVRCVQYIALFYRSSFTPELSGDKTGLTHRWLCCTTVGKC